MPIQRNKILYLQLRFKKQVIHRKLHSYVMAGMLSKSKRFSESSYKELIL